VPAREICNSCRLIHCSRSLAESIVCQLRMDRDTVGAGRLPGNSRGTSPALKGGVSRTLQTTLTIMQELHGTGCHLTRPPEQGMEPQSGAFLIGTYCSLWKAELRREEANYPNQRWTPIA